ncbi:MAG: hypothetical protein WCT77_01640 [Bacteroidota bacterium]|jgi:hypothetical protein
MNENCENCRKLIDFLDKSKAHILKNGIENTCLLLDTKQKICEEDLFDKIVEITLYEFPSMNKNDILKGVSRKDNVRFSALSIITNVSMSYSFSTKYISLKLNKSKTSVKRYATFIKELAENIKQDREIIQKHKAVIEAIKQLT